MLGAAAFGFGIIYGLNRLGIRAVPVYVLVGTFIWLAIYKSGIHPTVAGVLLGLLTPPRDWVSREALRLSLFDLAARLDEDPSEPAAAELQLMSFAAKESVAPLERLESQLHPWVGFAIMPIFALANAGVHVEPKAITASVSIAVAVGLFVGKPVGVMLFSFLAVKFGIAKLPEGVSWSLLLGGGFLAGIGFTMSLFVAGLAFGEEEKLLGEAKVGILLGSVCSALVGAGLLIFALQKAGEPGA
jgi:NhaA family Na+:H+ antiporter